MKNWELVVRDSDLVMIGRGHDRYQAFTPVIAEFHAVLAERSVERLIIDLREFTGYEHAARVAWQNALAAKRSRYGAVIVVGVRSVLVRMGVATAALFAGFDATFVETFEGLR